MTTTDTTTTATGPAAGQERAVYTVKETARLLSLSLNTTYALVRTGRIPAVQLGGRWVIPCQRFHQWLNDQVDQTGQEHLADATVGGVR